MQKTPKYLTEKQVSEMTQIAVSTLRNDRFLSRGIPYCKIKKSVRYSLEDVVNFLESCKVNMN